MGRRRGWILGRARTTLLTAPSVRITSPSWPPRSDEPTGPSTSPSAPGTSRVMPLGMAQEGTALGGDLSSRIIELARRLAAEQGHQRPSSKLTHDDTGRDQALENRRATLSAHETGEASVSGRRLGS